MIKIASKEDSKTIRILVVCLGNMCRSPAGEYLLRHYANEYHQNHPNENSLKIIIESAGLSPASIGMAPNTRTYLERKQIPPNHFTSQSIPFDPIAKFDWILVMDEYMKDEIIETYYQKIQHLEPKKYRKAQERIILYSVAAGRSGKIEDPYGYSQKIYFSILDRIDKDSQKIINRLMRTGTLLG